MTGKIKKRKFFGARFTSTISIALVLFVLGLMILSGLMASQLSVLLKERFSITVVLNDQADETSAKQLVKSFSIAPYAKHVNYISKDDALKTLTEELGENPKDFLGYNPLYASIEMQLKSEYACNDSIAGIVSAIQVLGKKQIESIDYNSKLISLVNNNLRKAGYVLCALAFVFLLISFSLISNTVHLTLHSERFLINTMKLVGATPWFIRRPFIGINMLYGFIASILALGGLSGLVYYGLSNTSSEAIAQLVLNPISITILVGSVIIVGMLIPAVAAWNATSKYINMKADDLYLM